MKKFISLLVISFFAATAFANHITGGTIYYTLQSQSGNSYTYRVTLLLYRDHNSGGAPLDTQAPISIFNRQTGVSVWSGQVPLASTTDLHLTNPSPCINNPPTIWYDLGTYNFTVVLNGIPEGYVIAYQRCCRIAGINNLIGSNNVGATYTAEIPGTSPVAAAPANNSAKFIGNDMVIVCANNQFCYDFGASDPDNDVLVYHFCNAYTGGTSSDPAPNPPAGPPYGGVPYNSSGTPPYQFDAMHPLGSNVTLDPNTGMMCGIAPTPGIYVVTVCVEEWRNGVLIATQRKDLQIKVGDCSLVDASLPSSIPVCDDFTKTFQNLSPANPLVTGYLWTFGDGGTSNLATPTHTYADTGTYIIKLVVNPGGECQDEATAEAHVYPGFFPGFVLNGVCANKPSQFFDTTKTVYGFVNSWSWDFGDLNTLADTSHVQNPVYSYPNNGVKNVRFIVTSNKGCIDTLFKDITIMDKPPLKGQPKDTLICNGASVQLGAIGTGSFSWSGPNIISNGSTQNPTVAPNTTSNYIVTLNDNGCINTDTVRVRVVNFVTLQGMPDSIICATDSVQLRLNSNGLHYVWTPALTLNNPNIQNPMALPVNTPTTYHVVASIDHCIATDDITISLVPYPTARAGADTLICFNSPAQLHATMVGSSFTWTPSASLDNPNSLNPIARPAGTTTYVLSVTDNLGCPKPKKDTIVVTVLPKILAFAGGDTAVVVGQPLQLNASGGVGYFWTPSTGLNHNNIANPIGIYNGSLDSIRYKVLVSNTAGCVDSAFVSVRVFRTNPQIFVPTAFTPNGDGLNDYVRPIAVGISKMDYFRVYNRWGQLVYSSTDLEAKGWDGKIAGKDQATAVFVWIVRGTDYTGKVVFAKGTVALIR